MKKLLPLLLLATLTTHAQEHEAYFSLSIDPNKAFGIIDNPRTTEQNTGIDFDLEIGVPLFNRVKVNIFYGAFPSIKYQYYGTGMDYYLAEGDWYDISLGAGIGALERKLPTGANWEREAKFGWLSWHTRTQGVFWIWRNLGAVGSMSYQRRPDLPKLGGIIEGNIGLRYKF